MGGVMSWLTGGGGGCGFDSSESPRGSNYNSPKTSNKITAHDQAVLDMKLARDSLKKYQARLEIIMAKEKEIARTLLRDGKRSKAVLALKKKRYQEQLLERSIEQLNNIQQMIDTIEFKQIEVAVFQEMKKGTATLKQLNQELSLEDVEQLMEDTQDALDYQKQVEEALAGQLTEFDNEAIENELEELEKSSLLIRLPETPQTALPKTKAKEAAKVATTSSSDYIDIPAEEDEDLEYQFEQIAERKTTPTRQAEYAM
eukprot:TRINITY_DN566_c1_g7_i1.p1 TRINITY_DN566_c1_g7~~TRINITY_DN566_c1_g7_i1.p1  ORF type:complete len:257 (-),score=89.28 TRINITY_DN566_c1_g7_i1:43-813(-)